jgi:hypothetical protein
MNLNGAVVDKAVSKSNAPVVDFATAEDLVNWIEKAQRQYRDGRHRFIWRGHSDHTFQLVPTALREKGKIALRRLYGEQTMLADTQHSLELAAVAHFYRRANWFGVGLPSLPEAWHRILLGAPDSLMLNRDYIEKESHFSWPPRALDPVIALAQHYGVPTRFLDWTSDALIGACFAANGCLSKLTSMKADEVHATNARIEIWMALETILLMSELITAGDGRPVFGQIKIDTKFRVRIVDTPYGSNLNLAAQKGRFTCLVVDKGVTSVSEDTPLDAALEKFSQLRGVAERVGDGPLIPDFCRLTLPIAQVPRLLHWLRMREYDAAKVFPGLHSIFKATEERALCDDLLKKLGMKPID